MCLAVALFLPLVALQDEAASFAKRSFHIVPA